MAVVKEIMVGSALVRIDDKYIRDCTPEELARRRRASLAFAQSLVDNNPVYAERIRKLNLEKYGEE